MNKEAYAKNLIIRDLPDEVNAALIDYKVEYSVSSNSEAARQMITEYWDLRQENARLRGELDTANEKMTTLLNLFARKDDLENSIHNHIKAFSKR